jgi:hypothetical protein
VDELVELDPALFVLHRNDRIADLDQIILLHVEDFLANLLGFGFTREGDEHEISHGEIPSDQAAAVYRT